MPPGSLCPSDSWETRIQAFFFGGTIPVSLSPLPTYGNTIISPASWVRGLSEPTGGWVRWAAGRLPHTPGLRGHSASHGRCRRAGPVPDRGADPSASRASPAQPAGAPGAGIPPTPGRTESGVLSYRRRHTLPNRLCVPTTPITPPGRRDSPRGARRRLATPARPASAALPGGAFASSSRR